MKRLVFLAIGALGLSLPLAAQNIDTSTEYFRGFNSYNVFDFGSFDSVNEDNDNLTVDIPIISYPQRGTLPDFQLKVHYTGISWYLTCTIVNNIQQCRWYPGSVGGSGSAPYRGAYLTFDPYFSGGNRYCSYNNCFRSCPCRNYYIRDASGGIHNEGGLSGSGVLITIDGSGIGGGKDRNGIYMAPTQYKDPMGNTITQDYLNAPYNWTDSVGRIIPSSALPSNSNGPLPGCTTKNFPIVNGGTAPITICATSVSYSSQFVPDALNGINFSDTKAMVTSITLPNNTTWTFSYNSWGDLAQITTPTGGSVSYAWNNQVQNSASAEAYYRGIATRKANANDGTGDKTWTYSATLNGTVYPGVTDPDGDMTVLSVAYCPVYGANSCVYTRRKSYTPGGVLLKTVDTQYTATENPLDYYDPIPSVQYMLPINTTTTWPNGFVSQTAITYDPGGIFVDGYNNNTPYPFPYGSIVQKQEYDYGPSAPGSLLRQTNTQFQWQIGSSFLTANLLSQPASVTVYDSTTNQCKGLSNPCAQTNYAYDETGNGSVCTTLPCGNLTSVTRWLNGGTSPKTQYVYNSQGMRTKLCDPIDLTCANPTVYTYDSTGLFLSQVQYPNTGSTTHIELFNYDSNTGLLNWHKDQNSQQTSFGYDSMRRPTSVSYPDGGSETFNYTDSTPTPYFDYTKKITSSITLTERGTADGFGRPIQTRITVPSSTCSGGYVYVKTSYDNEGRKGFVSNPDCSSNPTVGTSYAYDPLNRITMLIPADGSTSSNNITTSYTGNCTTTTDQVGNQRKSCIDGLGRMTQVFEPDPTSNSSFLYESDYFYDALDNLTYTDQRGNDSQPRNWRNRDFSYDSLSRLLFTHNPEMGTVAQPSYSLIQYSYDANGNVATKDVPAANATGSGRTTITYCYDALNRLTMKAYSAATCSSMTPDVTYVYDGNSVPSGCSVGSFSYGSYPKPRRTAMCDSAGSEAWSYDQMGRGLSVQRTTNSVTDTFAYTYNYDGSVAALAYPSGHTITYTPNAAAQPVSAVDGSNNYATNAVYAPQGALASLTDGSSLVSTFYYNSRLQPCRISVKSNGSLTAPTSCTDIATGHVGDILDLGYCYNSNMSSTDRTNHNCTGSTMMNNGNVAQIANYGTTGRTQNFTYDTLNRIKEGYTEATSGSGCWGETFTIDPWANLTAIGAKSGYTGCTQENLSLSINNKNQITNTGFLYSTAGNLRNDGTISLLYDAENRIWSVGGLLYYYNGDGKRVKKSSGTLYWYGMGSDPLLETDASGNLTYEYIFFGGKRIARRDSSSNVNYYIADHLGSARKVVRPGGINIVQKSVQSQLENVSSNLIMTLPNSVASGNSLLLMVAADAGVGGVHVTDNQSNAYSLVEQSVSGDTQFYFVQSPVAGNTTVTIATNFLAGGSVQAILLEVSGLTSSAIDVHGKYAATGSPANTGTVTTTNAPDVLISMFWGWPNPSGNGVQPAGYTLIGSTRITNSFDTNELDAAYQMVASTGTYSPSWTSTFGNFKGITVALTNTPGSVVDDCDFYPYGKQVSSSCSSSGNTYKFTGKERDSESGLDNFGARYDSSQYGRFMTPDPIWVKADRMLDPQRLNLYAYGRNNPLTFSDPSGMDVTLGNCAGDKTETRCFYEVQQGLRKEDRSHVHLVQGNGQNGFKKGKYGITVDADYKSTSSNFQMLQSLAGDHSATARIDVYNPTDTFKIQTVLSYNIRTGYKPGVVSMSAGNLNDPSENALGGYTFFPYPNGPGPWSTGNFTDAVVNTTVSVGVPAAIYHELAHVFLGDFGRSVPNALHSQPGQPQNTADTQTKAAEDEALQNQGSQ